MLQRMEAEICCTTHADAVAVTADLIDNDCSVSMLDWIDDDGSAVWIIASTLTELDQSGFFDWVKSIVERPSVFVVEAGLKLTQHPSAFDIPSCE